MANVAFLFTGIGSLSGGGGAERFFSDFFDKHQNSESKYKLFFITDSESVKHFNSVGSLKSKSNVVIFKIINNRFKSIIESFQIAKLIIRYRIKLIQIPLYNIHYFSLVKSIDALPKIIRPKICLTITDAFIPYYYFIDNNRGYNFKNILEPLFQEVNIDSVISWYELFKEFSLTNNLIKSNPPVFCINSRYTGKIFASNVKKQNHIIYAGRFTIAKRPMLFVEAINILKHNKTDFKDWKFFMYGKGNLENDIITKIAEYGIEHLVSVSHALDLTKVFEESKCFVSTQDFENFPSLSMNEAMAAGNAIISRNVGQTNLFVKDHVNGLLLKQDDEKGLAEAIEYFIKHPELHQSMSDESVRLTKEVHTFDNFKMQIESFWSKTLNY
ncbi:MAG: glycosyltransferase [Bacteroidota bacterium]|nr:glycosyltransferase [Bacteroidota bacterium]